MNASHLHHPKLSGPQSQRGLSLVEIMVALVISLVLMAGALTVLVRSKESYRVNEDLARVQENLRIASELITYELRMAGYFGCADNLSTVSNQLNIGAAGSFFDTSRPVEGVQNGATTASNWLPSNNTDQVATILPATDGITIRAIDGAVGIPLTATMSSTNSDLVVGAGQTIVVGSIMVVHDCAGSDIFQVTGFDASTGTINHAAGGSFFPGNAAATLSRTYNATTARVSLLNNVRFYIADNAGNPTLFRQVFDTATVGGNVGTLLTQPLVDGIENMQALYGEDTTGNNIPDRFVVASANAANLNWINVKGVRISLLARSVDEYGADLDTNTYNLNDVTVDPVDDRRLRKALTTTVLFRNLQ